MRVSMGSLAKVTAFVVATSLLTTLVGMTFGRVRLQESTTYSAVFTDVSGLKPGVDVRASGVGVGTVTGLELTEDNLVEVTFTVPSDLPLTTTTDARIRYANLTGDRYLDLTRGEEAGSPLTAGAAIPVDRTAPALDLDELFSGFQPLMQALSPDEVNDLSSSIIAITQGQGNAVGSLLTNVGSFTSELAERDQLIGQVITNLATVLGAVDQRSAEFDQLIAGLDDLVGGLAEDRASIGESLVRVNTLAGDTTSLLTDLRPGLQTTLAEVLRLGGLINDDADFVVDVFDRYRQAIILLGRGGAYGSFFNFYLCGARVKFSDPSAEVPIYSPWLYSEEARCTR